MIIARSLVIVLPVHLHAHNLPPMLTTEERKIDRPHESRIPPILPFRQETVTSEALEDVDTDTTTMDGPSVLVPSHRR